MGRKKKGELPSGNIRRKVYDYTDSEGKKHYKSFTASSTSEVNFMVSQFKIEKRNRNHTGNRSASALTVESAVVRYIEVKKGVLSPSTIRGYNLTLNRYVSGSALAAIKLYNLTNADLQAWVSQISSMGISAKTVANHWGLVAATIEMILPDFKIKIRLPQKQKAKLYTPSDEDVRRILDAIEDPELMAAVLLYATGPMRRGEICALTSDDIHGHTISINKTVVMDENGKWVTKNTAKTSSSIRELEFPDSVIDRLPQRKGNLFTVNPDTITHRFTRLIESMDVPYFTLHSLRHYAASIMAHMGISEKVVQERGGWATDRVMKDVYTNVIDLEKKKEQRKIFAHFDSLVESK